MSSTKLEKVIGCTACSRSLAVNPKSGLICYPAGSAIVIVNPHTQSKINLLSPGKCHLTCTAWSPCGQYIATGEFGTDPKVRIWTLKNCKVEPEGFSPDSDLLISIGNNHDKQIIIWEWKTKRKLAESRLTCQVNAMAQSASGKMFVTVGVRHVKFWYLERNGDNNNSILLQGRSAILSEQRNNTFIACCCLPPQRTFVLTLTRLLIEFVDKRLVNLYQMGDEVPLALTTTSNLIFIGFWNGTIRVIDSTNMEPVMELPKPLPLQKYSAECDGTTNRSTPDEELKYPDVHSLVFHKASGVLSALYSDRSLYHWQLQASSTSSLAGGEEGQQQESPIQQVVKLSSQHFHVGPIFDLETCDSPLDGANDFFLTAGADETVRFWSLSSSQQINSALNSSNSSLSPELKKVLFLSSESGLLTEQLDKNFGGLLSDSLESTTGVRCLRLSPNGEHLACGRKNGNICIFDLRTPNWPILVEFEAHEGEVLCLDYSNFNNNSLTSSKESSEPQFGLLLGSASRDRLIHIFDVERNYAHLLTLDEHRGPVTTLKFIRPLDSPLLLVSFGGDQLLISREIFTDTSTNRLSTNILVQIDKWPNEKTPNYLAIIENKNILIGCQNRSLCEIDPKNGHLLRTLDEEKIFGKKQEEEQHQGGIRITKICVDPSGTLAAILCSDRSVHLFDLKEEKECGGVESSCGVIGLPSDCVTGLAFLPDCRRLLLVTYSGCIAVWRLPSTLQRRIPPKISLLSEQTSGASPESPSIITTTDDILSDQFSNLANFIEHPPAIFSLSSVSSNIAKRPSTLQEADDELDSGIGGGEGGGSGAASADRGQQKKQQQSFEIKRLNPLDASILFSKQEEEQSEIGGEVINSMISSHSPMTRPQRSNVSNPHNSIGAPQQNKQHFFQHNQPIQHTPPQQQHFSHFPLLYTHPGQQQHLLNVHQPLQQQQPKNSRSMSNLHSTNINNGGQQQQNRERRKWNVGANTQQQHQQNQQALHPAQMFLQNQNGGVSSSPSPSMYLPVRPIQQQQLLTKDIINSNYLSVNEGNQQQQQRFGIGNSISLNAIRSGMIEKQQPQQDYGNRNSLSRRFLQTNIENEDKKDCVWRPNQNTKTSMLVKKRRSSNLFNTSKGGDEGAAALPPQTTSFAAPQQQQSSLLLANSNSPCSSSQASTPSGVNDFRHSPDGMTTNNISSGVDQKFGSGGGGGARLALNRIKQRRMAAAAANNNNNSDLPPTIGRQTPPAPPPRSRSQSPSQLAMALLASEAAALATARPQSPSVRSVLSGSSPSTTSRYQLRLSTVGSGVGSSSSSRLRQARQRLKKSQENLASLQTEINLNNDEEEEPLSRSRSIGNLWMTPTARRRTSLHSTDDRTQQNQREIAKSTTDLLNGQNKPLGRMSSKEDDKRGSKLGRLAESRQRLAQSIKDIRRISEPDIQPLSKENAQMAETPSSIFRGGPRRGVQKKLDKQLLQQTPPISARSFQHYNPGDWSTESSTSSTNIKTNLFQTGIRSATSLTPTTPITTTNNNSSAHSPRSNYLAQKLASRSGSGADSSTTTPLTTSRSFTSEFNQISNNLASFHFTSTGSKRMALHAQECIKEMQQASDKLLGTRQLIQFDPTIDSEEKLQLLFNVNKAVAAFSRRLTLEDEIGGQQQHLMKEDQQGRFANSRESTK
uniref:WD_REPEATS_REGION domain-containing protein n=1 Tax=Meloidogyne hapla TaxID=6305 RepID=A0A1I8B0X5_MELHA